ncbi:site-2 protease family protein [Altericroceibacterium spongiae]|uniref:Site-2 protease family protein n=1 Tax=Altericroceibacterium spongiae TaxID=2320269 RepID=A0A420EQV4_9SPHN|nr:site-2 protease family protein [Altericroceibacterium spongiae]RKF23055.1 site-2 protease family protein [Altericroceibacterium spongiae]
MSETLFQALALIPALVFAIVFHEVSHGWTALMLGDTTARDQRRLTLNPVRHVDPLGTLIVPGMLALSGAPVFGWAKPVPVRQRRLNNPRFGMIAVAAAGPLSNLLLAAAGAVILGLLGKTLTGPAEGVMAYILLSLNYFLLINIFLALFNLLPIPPFDGSHIVEGLLPPDLARSYARLRPFGFPLLFILLLVVPYLFPSLNIVENLVVPPVTWLQEHYMRLALWVAGA